MHTAFISYSTKDEPLARNLHSMLSAAGINTFLASISIKAGEIWTKEIFANLRKSKFVFFIASKNSCRSPAVQQELGASLIQDKVIIPLLTDITIEELPGWVDRHQALDLQANPEMLTQRIQQIVKENKISDFVGGLFLGAILAMMVFGD